MPGATKGKSSSTGKKAASSKQQPKAASSKQQPRKLKNGTGKYYVRNDETVFSSEHRCLFCNQSCLNEAFLEKHVNESHRLEDLIFECGLCGWLFYTPDFMMRHVKTHEKGGDDYEAEFATLNEADVAEMRTVIIGEVEDLRQKHLKDCFLDIQFISNEKKEEIQGIKLKDKVTKKRA